MDRLSLPSVTLCAATSVNLQATVQALHACLNQIDFAECLLLTHERQPTDDPAIRVVSVSPMYSSQAYSRFMLHDLLDHVQTEHCLVVQWDGFVLDSRQWSPEFLKYDYIGAWWPQFSDGHDVGNGGFSLRSRKLMQACRDPSFRSEHPEDVAICRLNRSLLEERHGIRFANRACAERFSFERDRCGQPTFGFHGVFNMVPVLGRERFWQVYRSLDERAGLRVDRRLLWRQLGGDRDALARRSRFLADHLLLR